MNDFVVDFQVTRACNLKCEFCCGADKKKKDSTYDEICDTIDKIAQIGVDRIVLTGGEPLIRNEIDDIMKYIYEKNISVYLSTNGYYIDKHMQSIMKYVDCVGLPLDGNTYELSENMSRNYNQIDTTFHAISELRKNCPDKIVKVGTVVSRINKDNLKAIGECLYKDENVSPNVWRLYQFTPLRRRKT